MKNLFILSTQEQFIILLLLIMLTIFIIVNDLLLNSSNLMATQILLKNKNTGEVFFTYTRDEDFDIDIRETTPDEDKELDRVFDEATSTKEFDMFEEALDKYEESMHAKYALEENIQND